MVDALALGRALATVGRRTAFTKIPRRTASLAFEYAKIGLGRSGVSPEPRDWRFTNRAWKENPFFRRLGQAYLATVATADQLTTDADLDWRTNERARFAVSLIGSTLSPTNQFLLNPDAMQRALETGGKSVGRGLRNVLRDVTEHRGVPRTVDLGAFEVGRNLAVTPGAVVHRGEVFELIQYTPTTPMVHDRPVVLVPPQINKYYFMDLAPGRSFVEYAVAQGFTTFVLSWRNPGAAQRGWNLDTYAAAAGEAMRIASEISGSEDVSAIALCAGGITTAALLGHLAATGEKLVHNVAFAVTVLDFEVPTMVGMFGTSGVAGKSERRTERAGFLEGQALSLMFALLRPNDLVWNYWVRNNLLGEDPPAFDVLAWNADASNLSAGLHADFLHIFLDNALSNRSVTTLGTPVDLGKVECDNLVVAARTDHLTGWRACYATTQLLGGPSEFLLSSSGHIQSLVNPPGNAKMTVATGPEPGPNPDEWLSAAATTAGSWWERWADWQRQRRRWRAPGTDPTRRPRPPAARTRPRPLRPRRLTGHPDIPRSWPTSELTPVPSLDIVQRSPDYPK